MDRTYNNNGERYVLCLVGEDRPGLVLECANFITKNAVGLGNIEDAMAYETGGHAVVMMRFSLYERARELCGAEAAKALEQEMKSRATNDYLIVKEAIKLPREQLDEMHPFLWKVCITTTDDIGLLSTITAFVREPRQTSSITAFHCGVHIPPNSFTPVCRQVFILRPSKWFTKESLKAAIDKQLRSMPRPILVSEIEVGEP